TGFSRDWSSDVCSSDLEAYSRPLNMLEDCARRLNGLPVLFVGVICPIEIVMARRNAQQRGRETTYVTAGPGQDVPMPVRLFQDRSEARRGGKGARAPRP